MVELDGDDIRISSRGKMAERDIVQVSFGSLLLVPGPERRHDTFNLILYIYIYVYSFHIEFN